MRKVILAHLFQIDCQMLVIFGDEKEEQCLVGFDFSSSRQLLITCGWVMAVSDFFGQTIHKLFAKKLNQIYKAKPLNLGSSQKTGCSTRIEMHEESPLIQRIAYMSKALKNRTYTIECLKAKKTKLLKKIKDNLK